MEEFTCNICGGSLWDEKHPNRCRTCKSVERTRAAKLILDKLVTLEQDSKILHCAPEPGMAKWLAERSPNGYDPVDYAPQLFADIKVRKFDLVTQAGELESDYYDLIIHIHVLEHLRINIAHTLHHFHRCLKPTGIHVFSVPFYRNNYWDEYFGPLKAEAARERFQHTEHVRTFGLNDINLHIGSVIRIDRDYSLYNYASSRDLDKFNLPESIRTGITGSSVFVTRKSDYLLWP